MSFDTRPTPSASLSLGSALPLRSRALTQLLDAFETTQHLRGSGLFGSSPSLVVASALQEGKGPFIVLTTDGHAATRALADLRFFLGPEERGRALSYPEWDTSPYDGLSPHAEIPIRRIEALNALMSGDRCAVVMSIRAALKLVIPPGELKLHRLIVEQDEEIDRDFLGETLVQLGYLATGKVLDPGSFSIRGGIVDLFPPGHRQPIRLEFFDTEVESIRYFDPETGKSGDSIQSLQILPVREEIMDPRTTTQALAWMRSAAAERSVAPRVRRRMIGDIEGGVLFPNIEYILPALYPTLVPLFDYLPSNGRVVLLESEEVRSSAQAYLGLLEKAYESNDGKGSLLPNTEALFLQEEDLEEALSKAPTLALGSSGSLTRSEHTVGFKTEPTRGLRQTLLSHRGEGMLTPLVERLSAWSESGQRTYIACRSDVQGRRIADLIGAYGVMSYGPRRPQSQDFTRPAPPAKQNIGPTTLLGSISEGFSFPGGGLTLLSEEEIFGPRSRSGSDSQKVLKNAIDSFSQLKEGEPVVHALHGIGLFRGIAKLPVGDTRNDFVQVEYQGGDKIYLPIHRLNTLQRYVGKKGQSPKLDKMGGQTWAKTTKRVKQSVLKVAQRLLDLYAARALAEGRSIPFEPKAMAEFEATFPFEETPDQLEAIHAVLGDMAETKPMDRLLCGDVGFGKTEVAMRAAFMAVHSGFQVAILVPTTVLAFQHYQTLKHRFEPLAISVGQLSRFNKGVKGKEVMERLKEGKVDIVVGTHRLLSRDVKFKRLGLLVIDEEHRFGVRHKEHLKSLRKNLDVLTMTATPIPRTLNMAMTGMRDFSVIATPPRERTPVQTQVVPFSAGVIREAIQQELHRGGQVFFVHNRVKPIKAMAQYLSTLVPEAEIGMVHGQLPEKEIEDAMVRFVRGDFNVLVTTSIIESGLDIPRANTIIISRADQLGLAQLYQLRGRVGRANRRAYAYLLTPAAGAGTPKGAQRLLAMEKHTDLGAGFKIANEDLELRGAGNLLGKNQSGSISAVGFETYIELLQQTIQELRGRGDELEADFDPDVDIKVDAYIPEDYIPSFEGRLRVYRSLSMAASEGSLFDLVEAMQDEYGTPPEPVQELIGIMECRLMAKTLRIARVLAHGRSLRLYFDETTPVSRRKLAALAGHNPERYRLYPEGRVGVMLEEDESAELVGAVKKILRKLG